MSRPDRYPDFFDPIFDAVPRPPDPERDFSEWFGSQRAETVPSFHPEAPCGRGALMRFTAKGAPLMQASASTAREAEDIFLQKARAYWEVNVKQ